MLFRSSFRGPGPEPAPFAAGSAARRSSTDLDGSRQERALLGALIERPALLHILAEDLAALTITNAELGRLGARTILADPTREAMHEAIASHDTIQFGAAMAAPEWRFVEQGRDIRVVCTPRLTTNSSDAAIHYAAEGGGLTRVLAYQAAEAIKAGQLKIVLATFEPPALPIHVVYPTSRLLSAKVRAFIDLVAETDAWHFG